MSQATQNTKLSVDDLERSYPDYFGQIEHTVTLPSEEAETVPTNTVLADKLANKFPHDNLYTHQAEALNILGNGNNVCVATSTSSGKTMTYALQIARNKQDNPDATAMLIYPTKALSRDQEFALNNLYSDLGLDISVQVYDGDTPGNRRKRIRNNADVIITNFSGIQTYMNNHPLWDQFYENLELIAIDESHSYTGIHGMHVSWTLRRLRRIIDHYGPDPQFVLTSATIGNPAEHSKRLTGVDVDVVMDDGSPTGERDIVFWRPPVQNPDGDDDGHGAVVQRPADQEASEVLAHLTQQKLQTLMFTRSRKQTELNAQRARNAVRDHPNHLEPEIESYNAGHGKETRRSVENRLKDGGIDGVITTNALELGIDIGSVDAAVLAGYPGTRQSFWQQLGRAGRGTSSALGMLVAQHDSIDQYILNNPDYLLSDDNIENAVVDLENNFVFANHLLCASQEIPLTRDDSQWFDPYRMEAAVDMWKSAGMMVGTLEGGVQYNGPRRPQSNISMYATTDEQFEIRCDDDSIDMEPIDKQRAYRDYHEGAIVLNKGQQYEVKELVEDTPRPYVKVESVNVNYYTQSISETSISDLNSEESRDITSDMTLHWGKGTVNIEYTGYKKKNISSNKAEPQVYSTDLPPIEMQTQLTWVEIGDDVVQGLHDNFSDTQGMSEQEAALGGLHAIEHGLISLAPLELRMDKQDLGGLSQLDHVELDQNGVFFVYDGVEGGVGFAHAIYDHFDSILERTETMIDECDCHGVEGCPACVMEDSCGSGNEPLHTEAALSVIGQLTD
jgi:DEAD/DEAH box helicase domain-containing protein